MSKVYTVLQVNKYIKNMFDTDFMLNNLSIKGEVSNCRYHSSGHIYFTLKDEGGTISAVMFASNRASGLNFRLEDGIRVIVNGSISVYETAGKYQIYVTKIKMDGEGELYGKFIELKNRLDEMGMFDSIYKKPVPSEVKRIGIVTARTGAAVHDIISVSRRRNPAIEIILYPAKVQGDGAAQSICRGIDILSQAEPDVIIVGRGGGSIEDLWAFNEEMVARAVFNCDIPIISAVGHETDFTIIDFVADLRAPTPSAAAELAVKDTAVNKTRLMEYYSGLNAYIDHKINDYVIKAENIKRNLKFLSPVNILNNRRMMFDDAADKLNYLINKIINDKQSSIRYMSARLEGMSPHARLNSGYSYTVNEEGRNVNSVRKIHPDDRIKIHLMDGYINAIVENAVESEVCNDSRSNI